MIGRLAPLLISCPAFGVVLLLMRSTAAQEDCFVRLDTGVDMTGWQPSTTNNHGPGAGWSVEEGALVGRQTEGQQGGILMTEQSYTDVEVQFEVKIDWGCDSGFFFRTTDGSRAYQVTIDHVGDSAVGTIWGEFFSPELRAIPYWLTDNGNAAIVAPDQADTPIFDLADWPSLWNPTEFNEMRATIEGNPPQIQVWISGTQVMDFTDTMLRGDVNASGPLAIQVHGGSRWITDGTVAFRNIRVRDLSLPCESTTDAGVGGSTSGTVSTAGTGTSTSPSSSAAGGATGDATPSSTSTTTLGDSSGAAQTSTAGSGSGGANQANTGEAVGQTSAAQSSGLQAATTGASVSGSATMGAASDSSALAVSSGTGGSDSSGAEPTHSGNEAGCGCRVGGRSNRDGALWLLLGLALGVSRRRRSG